MHTQTNHAAPWLGEFPPPGTMEKTFESPTSAMSRPLDDWPDPTAVAELADGPYPPACLPGLWWP